MDELLCKYGYDLPESPEDQEEYQEAKAVVERKLQKLRREALKVAILDADNRNSTVIEEETGIRAVKRTVKLLRKL